MKSYTDLEQSKKLAEFLPLESADMQWIIDDLGEPFPFPVNDKVNENEEPCWSLAALLNILDFPALTQEDENEWEVCVRDYNNDEYIEIKATSPVDAAFETILKLNELNLL